MLNKKKSPKGKTIFILKKENLFPDWGVFKKVNKIIWKIILKKIKKSENKKIKIIADNEIFTILKDMKIKNLVKINEYIPNKYENVYEEAFELFKKWFSQEPLKNLRYDEMFIKDIIEQEFCYSIMESLNNLKIIDYIIKKENPNKIKIINEKYLFGKICKQYCLENNISFNSINKGGMLKKLDYFIKKISFFARFKNIPLINRREFVKTQNKNMKNKEFILFGVHDDYYYSRLQNVINTARLDNLDIKGIITNNSTQKRAKKDGLDFFSFGDFFENNQKLKDFKKELIKKEKIFNKYFQNKGLNYGGQNVFPIFKEYFNYLFKIRFLWTACYINAYDNLFKKNKIKAVVIMDDLIPVNRSLVLVAKKYNIPSIVVPHGVFIDTAGKGFIPLTADKMAIWGKIIKNQMIDFEVNSKKLIITGASIFDDIVQKQKNNKNQFKENKKKKFSLMLGIQKYDDVFADKETEKIIKTAIESVQEFKDVELKISLHPRLSSNIIKSILKEKKGNICIEKGKIEDLIKNCDGLITLYSTIAFNSMFENKPIISLNPLNRPEIIPYVESGAALKARNKKELISAIKKIKSEKYLKEWIKRKEKFLKNYLFKLDGRASKRVVKVIKDMVDK